MTGALLKGKLKHDSPQAAGRPERHPVFPKCSRNCDFG